MSVTLVALLTVGGFAGMLVTGTPVASAANVAIDDEPNPTALGAAALSTTFGFTIMLNPGTPLPTDDEVLDGCTYSWNAGAIPAGELGDGLACAEGANSKTWTPAAANAAYANAASSVITITATFHEAGPPGVPGAAQMTSRATVTAVVVDFDAPSVANDAVRIIDSKGNAVSEALNEFGTVDDLIGGTTFSIELQNDPVIDPFLQTVELQTCAGSVKQTLTAPFGATITISNIPAADLATGTGNNLPASFRLRYIDRSGNAVNTSCFNFHIDNKGPDVAWLVNPGPFTIAHSFEQDADFTVADPNELAAGGVTLSWTGPETDSSTAAGTPKLFADFAPDFAGSYALTIDAEDVFGNTGSASRTGVKFDPVAPEITRVEFNDDGACDPHVFLPSGTLVIGDSSSTYCEGPYVVTIFVREEFPAGGASPTAPTITPSEFTFPNAPTVSRDAGASHTDQIVDVWKFTYTDVTVAAGGVAPFTFDVNVNEEAGAPLGRATIAPKTNIGFTTTGTPRVDWNPGDTIFGANPQFALNDVTILDNPDTPAVNERACPAVLDDNEFCTPGAAAPTVKLEDLSVAADAANRVLATFTDPDGNKEWTATVGGDVSRIATAAVRVTQGAAVGQSDEFRLVLDLGDPTLNAVTLYRWESDNDGVNTNEVTQGIWEEIVAGNDATVVPVEGPYLVRFPYTSFGAREIAFRFVLNDDDIGTAQERWVEYGFLVETTEDPDGTGPGEGHDNVPLGDQVVFLAEGFDSDNIENINTDPDPAGGEGGLPLTGTIEDAVRATGCESDDAVSRLWGNNRACYFILNLAAQPSARSAAGVNLDPQEEYFIQPVIRESTLFKRNIVTATDSLYAPSEEPSLELQPSITPAAGSPPTIELGVTTTLRIDVDDGVVNDNERREIDVWVCAVRPGLDDPFAAYESFSTVPGADTPWDDEPDCEFLQNPTGVDVPSEPGILVDGERRRLRSVELTTVAAQDAANRGRTRELAFNINALECEKADGSAISPTICKTDPAARALDRIYFRFIARDTHGNVAQTFLQQATPFTLVERVIDRAPDPPANPPPDPLGLFKSCVNDNVRAACTTLTKVFRDDPGSGCLQPNGLDNILKLGADNVVDNSFTADRGPCFQALDNVPGSPYPKFSIPVLLENFGNAEDDVIVSAQHRAGRGEWTVRIVDSLNPSTAPNAQGELTVQDIPARRSLTEPSRRQITVEIQPTDDALGGDFKTIDLRVKSGLSKAPGNTPSSFFIRAQLIELDRGQILLGTALAEKLTVEAEPEDIFDVPFSLKNTGNARREYSIGIDQRSSRSTPSTIADGAGSFHRLCQIGGAPAGPPGTREDYILIDVQQSDGSSASDKILSPGQQENLKFRIDVGRNVPASESTPHRCSFTLLADTDPNLPGDEQVSINPLEPTLSLDVVGEAALRLWELIPEEFNAEVDVTGTELVRYVPPTATVHDLILFMENAGTISLEPALEDPVLVLDRLALAGRWVGVDPAGAEMQLATAQEAFDLAVTDLDDPARIKDFTTDGGRFTPSAIAALDPPIGEGRWECGGGDLSTPPDNEDRILCRIHMRFKVPVDGAGQSRAVAGDEVVYDFEWADIGAGGEPTSLRVRLVFQHIGETTVSSMTNPVVADEQRSRITLVTNLEDGREFDLATRSTVPSTVEFRYDHDGSHHAPLACVEKVPAPHTDQVSGVIEGPVSTSETGGQAFFEIPVIFTGIAEIGPGTVAVSASGLTLTGTGTTFTTAFAVGDSVQVTGDSAPRTIASIASATTMTLNAATVADIRGSAGLTYSTAPTLPGPTTCLFGVRPNGDWAFTVPATSVPGSVEAKLFVGDEDRSAARVVGPAHVRFVGVGADVVEPADATRLTVEPSGEQDATGRQFSRFSFDPAGGSATVAPAGVLFSRGTGVSDLEAYVDCRLETYEQRLNAFDGLATQTFAGDTVTVRGVTGPLVLGRIAAATPGVGNPFTGSGTATDMDTATSSTQKVLAATNDVHGMVLRRQTTTVAGAQVQQALHVGNVHLYTWGVVDPAGVFHPAWREGLNRVVAYVEDTDTVNPEPALGGTATSLQAQFQFLLRDDDPAPADKITDRYKMTLLSSTSDSVRNMGGGIWWVEFFIPEGVSATQPAGANDLLAGKVLSDYRLDQASSQQPYAAYALRIVIQSGKSAGGDDLRGEAAWRLEDLGMLATGALAPDARKGTRGDSAILDGGISTDRTDLTTQSATNPATQAKTFLHRWVGYSVGPVSPARGPSAMPWLTGPGVQNVIVALMEQRSQPNSNGVKFGDLAFGGEETIKSSTTPFRDSTLAPSTQGKVQLRVEPFDRPLAGRSTLTLASASTSSSGMAAIYSGVMNLFDTGQDATDWRLHMTISDSQFQRQQMDGQLRVIQGRQSSSNGVPMPLCLGPPANAFPSGLGDVRREIGEFDRETLGELLIVDSRVYGIPLDRGQFSWTPFVANLDGGGDTLGFNRDQQVSFRILGGGLVKIDSADIPAQAEADVPIPISVKVTGIVDTVTAILEKDGVVIEQKVLTLVAGLYTGTLTPPDVGEYVVRIRATDVAGDVVSLTKDVEVVGNAPPRIAFTRPVEVGGARAIQPGGSIEVTVTDKSITASAITVSVQDAEGAFQTVTEGVSVTCAGATGLCTVTYTPPNSADGQSIVMKVKAVIAEDDQAESDATTIKVDGGDPNVALTIGSPKITGDPTIVGPGTEVTIAANDAGTLSSMLIRAVRDGTTIGSKTFTGPTGGEVTLSALGLTDDGVTATLVGVAEDVAGNQGETSVTVKVDAAGPVIDDVDARRAGTGVRVQAAISDEAAVSTATLFFQRPGETQFTSIPMEERDGVFQAIVTNPGSSGTLRYFVRATDALGNTGNFKDSGTPERFALDGGTGGENSAPVISILSPRADDRVSGTVTVEYEVTDPDGDPVTVTSAKAGSVTLDPTRRSVPVDTRTLPEGVLKLTISATDGVDTATEEISVFVDNLPDAGSCTPSDTLGVGSDVPVCFRYTAPSDTSSVKVDLLRNGQSLDSTSLDPQPDGTYEATFDIENEGTYSLRITPVGSDGTEGTPVVSEPFQVQGAFRGVVDQPIVRFIIALVLGVVVLGVAAFGAFGRWK